MSALIPSQSSGRVPGSFRDPAAFVYRREGVLYRQLRKAYMPHYRAFMDSRLYDLLRAEDLIVSHVEMDQGLALEPDDAGAVLRPQEIPFISLPSEWTFEALKRAALLTLRVMELSLQRGMILKDASARNVQFIGTKPVFIDMSSFERYAGGPWRGYLQFCEHFLAPMALMSFCGRAAGRLLQAYPDGIPLRVATRMLPLRARLRPGLALHLFGHAAFVGRTDGRGNPNRGGSGLDAEKLLALVRSLRRTIERLHPAKESAAWSSYRGEDTYGDADFARKKEAVTHVLKDVGPATVWDIGANDGVFAGIAADAGVYVIAWESDHAALSRCFLRAPLSERMLPLFLDFNHLPVGGGVLGAELPSIFDRGQPSLVMLLGIVHHLCLTQNIPLRLIADFCAKAGTSRVLVEWVEPTDTKAADIIARKPEHHAYSQESFRAAFAHSFMQERVISVSATRSLYLFAAR